LTGQCKFDGNLFCFFLPPAKKKKEALPTNSTFGFLPTRNPTLKKPKELFLANARFKIYSKLISKFAL